MANLNGLKVLYVAITLPEYRLQFSKELSALIDVDYCVLNEKGALATYGIDTTQDLDSLSILHFNGIENLIQKLVSGGYSIVVVPSVESVHLYRITKMLIEEAKKRYVRVVYFNEHWLPPRNRIPFVKRCKNLVRFLLIKSIIGDVDVCIAAGSKAAEYYMNKLKIAPEKVRIAMESSTNPSVDVKFSLKKKCGIPEDSKIVLYLGRIIERKGLDILIRAMESVQKAHEDAWLIVCGKGGSFEKRCRELAEKCGIKNICFYGLVEPKYRANVYEDADVFVLPSYFEGGQIEAWGLTVNESLAVGTPVVATTAVGAAYDLIDEKNGVIIEENNEAALVEAIESVLYSDEYQVEECRKTASKYNVQAMAKSFYEAMISNAE